MRISTNHLVLGLISALIIGGAFAVTFALAGPARQAASTTTPGTSTASAQPTLKPTPAPPDLVRIWSSMCVQGVPYTLLSVPTDAKFALVVPEGQVAPPAATSAPSTSSSGTVTPQAGNGSAVPGTMTPQASIGSAVPVTGAAGALGQMPTENSCTALGTVSGVQLIICTGPQGKNFTLYVHGASGTQTFQGTLWDCTGHKAPSAPATTGPTSLPTTLPTGTVPPTVAPTNPPATPTP